MSLNSLFFFLLLTSLGNFFQELGHLLSRDMLFEHSQSGSLLEKFADCRKDSFFNRIVLQDIHQVINNGLVELDKGRKIADREKFFEDDWVFLSKVNKFECG